MYLIEVKDFSYLPMFQFRIKSKTRDIHILAKLKRVKLKLNPEHNSYYSLKKLSN